MKPRLLPFFALTLAALSLSGASALTLSGTVDGNAPGGTRISAWAVTPFGQPVQELGSASLSGNTFTLTLPGVAPPARALANVDEHLTWPGLLDFGKASATAQAAEVKFFVYSDENGNGTRQDNENLREVRLDPGKGQLFVVWASAPVSVTGSRDYRADLQKGWNALVVDVRSSVSVKPFDSKSSLKLNLSN